MNWKQALLLAVCWSLVSLLIALAFTFLMGITFEQGIQLTLILYGIMALGIAVLALTIYTFEWLDA